EVEMPRKRKLSKTTNGSELTVRITRSQARKDAGSSEKEGNGSKKEIKKIRRTADVDISTQQLVNIEKESDSVAERRRSARIGTTKNDTIRSQGNKQKEQMKKIGSAVRSRAVSVVNCKRKVAVKSEERSNTDKEKVPIRALTDVTKEDKDDGNNLFDDVESTVVKKEEKMDIVKGAEVKSEDEKEDSQEWSTKKDDHTMKEEDLEENLPAESLKYTKEEVGSPIVKGELKTREKRDHIKKLEDEEKNAKDTDLIQSVHDVLMGVINRVEEEERRNVELGEDVMSETIPIKDQSMREETGKKKDEIIDPYLKIPADTVLKKEEIHNQCMKRAADAVPMDTTLDENDIVKDDKPDEGKEGVIAKTLPSMDQVIPIDTIHIVEDNTRVQIRPNFDQSPLLIGNQRYLEEPLPVIDVQPDFFDQLTLGFSEVETSHKYLPSIEAQLKYSDQSAFGFNGDSSQYDLSSFTLEPFFDCSLPNNDDQSDFSDESDPGISEGAVHQPLPSIDCFGQTFPGPIKKVVNNASPVEAIPRSRIIMEYNVPPSPIYNVVVGPIWKDDMDSTVMVNQFFCWISAIKPLRILKKARFVFLSLAFHSPEKERQILSMSPIVIGKTSVEVTYPTVMSIHFDGEKLTLEDVEEFLVSIFTSVCSVDELPQSSSVDWEGKRNERVVIAKMGDSDEVIQMMAIPIRKWKETSIRMDVFRDLHTHSY
ncbi:hypothetical protein PENTCL1PPCAC_27009, partial [Pristionchus entomophagus]